MANLSKIKRDQMIAFLESLKESHSDDASIQAFNEIENHIRDKKYGLVWEEHSEEVDDLLKENIPILTADPERRLCKDASLPWNFIIEGDNLQALYLLQKTHKGKVDCIYIDPPYNTGARDWKYNNNYVEGTDVYRHSKWLSMLKNRLLLAKELLNPNDSVLICTIDEKEYLRLGCLLEELFPDSTIQMVTSMTNKKGQPRPGRFSRSEEYIFFVFIGNAKVKKTTENMLFSNVQDDIFTSNTPKKSKQPTIWNSLLRRGTHADRADRPKLFYPIFVNEKTCSIEDVGEPLELGEDRNQVMCPEGCSIAWPIHKDGSEGNWQMKPDTLRKAVKDGVAKMGQRNKKTGNWAVLYLKRKQLQQIKTGEIVSYGKDLSGALILQYAEDEMLSLGQEPRSLWVRDSHDASVYGSTLVRLFLPGRKFPFPKSLYAVQDTLRFVVGDKPNAVVVDFFAGSGTTQHAVSLLNLEDSGQRKCIMVTNNELSDEEEKSLKKKGFNKGDKEWEDRGIARYITWPRVTCYANGVNIHGKRLVGNYLGVDYPISKGFSLNVKYFKCSWTPRKPEDYLLSNALCLHIKEMIELQNAIEVDNVKNVLILNKEDFKRTILNADVHPYIERVWVNQNIIFSTEELKALKEIGYKYIPREFFGQELREAAE